jgi:prevent-host-death family protein
MQVINTHQAKTHLSKLLQDVAQGKEVVIGKFGVPIAKLVPIHTKKKKRKGGQCKGRIKIAKDFDALPMDFLQHFTA